MSKSEQIRIIDFAKVKEYKRYEKVYVLFLWVSSIGVIGIGLVVTVGVVYMLSKEYYILAAGNCKAFIYGSAFLLCGGLLALLSGILTCAISTTKGKFVLTIFFGHIFAIGLVVSGLIMAVKMSKAIDSNPYGGTNTIIESFQNTISDSQYRHHWIRIHQDFRCCGIEGLEKYLYLVEDNITFVKYYQIWSKRFTTVFKSPEPEPSMTENEKKQLEKLLVVAKKMGVNIDLCPNILRDAHRGCGLLLLSRLDKKTNLLKFYGTLILPMIFIADMLFFLGYLCFKEIKITLMSEVVPK